LVGRSQYWPDPAPQWYEAHNSFGVTINEHFGALVTSDQPITVERALYWDADGQIWAAGTNATAMRLP
jgi:hypothetical protein